MIMIIKLKLSKGNMPETKTEEKDLSIKVGEDGRVKYGKDLSFVSKLNYIQAHLKSPKNQVNNFGGFNYRSCEDIVEALKPLLGDIILLMNDELVQIGDRYYIKANVSIEDGRNGKVSVQAYARETESKVKMDDAQVTGGASSYARKYALNGLLAIDDAGTDPDTLDNSKKKAVRNPVPVESGVRVEPVDQDPDWIRKPNPTPSTSNGKCPECGAMGMYHRKGCPYAG